MFESISASTQPNGCAEGFVYFKAGSSTSFNAVVVAGFAGCVHRSMLETSSAGRNRIMGRGFKWKFEGLCAECVHKEKETLVKTSLNY